MKDKIVKTKGYIDTGKGLKYILKDFQTQN